MTIARLDVVISVGYRQVCAGLEGGCKAAVHAMRNIFSHEDTEGILLVEAANVFNNLNRKAAVHNMNFIWPALAIILTKSYQSPTKMFETGGGKVLSSEGTTQYSGCHCSNQ